MINTVRVKSISTTILCRRNTVTAVFYSTMASQHPIGGNGLCLYYHHYSYYTQKVIMAMHEKKIPFIGHLVDISRGEQYSSWYLAINPRGEVPVLKDGVKLIPDSARIIDYLEDNFSNGNNERLIPIDQGADLKKKVLHFRALIDQLPAAVITLGSFFNPEFCSNYKFPFISAVRKHLKSMELRSSDTLRTHAANNPSSRDVLLQKASYQEKRHRLITDRDSYLAVLRQVEEVLDEVDHQIGLNEKDNEELWLCCSQFTAADISLTILLDRLSRLGLQSYFWQGKRHNVARYYERVQLRSSYVLTVPGTVADVALVLRMAAPLLFGVGLVTVLAAVVGGLLILNK